MIWIYVGPPLQILMLSKIWSIGGNFYNSKDSRKLFWTKYFHLKYIPEFGVYFEYYENVCHHGFGIYSGFAWPISNIYIQLINGVTLYPVLQKFIYVLMR